MNSIRNSLKFETIGTLLRFIKLNFNPVVISIRRQRRISNFSRHSSRFVANVEINDKNQGFGMAAQMEKFETAFPHPFIIGEYGDGFSPKTMDEMDMMKLSMDIREKPDWTVKINDPQIVSKWKEEIADKISQSGEKFDYVMKELGWYLSLKAGNIEPAAIDGTWQSDSLIGDSLRQELIEEVALLENVPDNLKDWHPGSNNLVLDLVHPSLFPWIEGRTKILKEPMCPMYDSQDNKIQIQYASEDELLSPEEAKNFALRHTEPFPTYAKSAKFQWLPSEVQVDPVTGSVQYASYINNLHPDRHTKLYGCLENILEKFIPMFNKVLTDLRNPRGNRMIVDCDWYEHVEMEEEPEDSQDSVEEPPKIPIPLKIPTFSPPPPPATIVDLKGRGIQVITKLANIHLTPEKPEYAGGVWHVEGCGNERIVASGIYYYSCHNVTESRLEFRQAIQEPDYEQYDNKGVKRNYDLEDEQALNQFLGSIITKEGRCIGFSNMLQHKVAPFKLEDPTRPGHRKILVFFLVDPSVKIVSTALVPPQQKSWFRDEVDKQPAPVPEEIVHKIVGLLDWPMTLEEAKEHRTKLMEERKYFVSQSNEMYFERPFSLCEH